MQSLVQRFLQEAKVLWTPGIPLVLAISGGSDSMALLALAAAIQSQWPVDLYPWHMDHGIRPESKDEASWVQDTVRRVFGLTVRIESRTVMANPGESLEMAARRVRYQSLRDLLKLLGPGARAALAHQRDDQAETILMRILLGTGIEGLRGMEVKNGPLVRPLLSFSRAELRDYLRAQSIEWLDDPMNDDRHWPRNLIRHEVLPLLREKLNPNVDQALLRLGAQAGKIFQPYAKEAEAYLSTVRLNDDRVVLPAQFNSLALPVKSAVLSRIGRYLQIRLGESHIVDALRCDVHWPGGYHVRHVMSGEIEIVKAWPQESGPRPGKIELRIGKIPWYRGALEISRVLFNGRIEPGKTYIRVDRSFWVRPWQPGDRLKPIGLKGHKKVHDIFVDKKVPRTLRGTWPVIVDSQGRGVLAVAGLAVDENYKAILGQDAYRIVYQIVVDSPSVVE